MQLFVLLLEGALEHAFVLFCVLLELLVKRTHLFLCLLGLSRLQLIDISDKAVLLGFFGALIWYAFFNNHFEVAVEKVKPRYAIPWLEGVASEDNHFVLSQDLLQLLRPLVNH